MVAWIPLLIGLAMSAGGAAMSSAGAAQSRRKMNNMVQDQLDRNKRYADEGKPIVKASTEDSSSESTYGQIAEGTRKRLAAYQGAQDQPLDHNEGPGTRGAPKEVKTESRLRTGAENIARAKLGGYSEWELKQAIKNMRVNSQLHLLGGMAQDSTSVLPLELRDAQSEGADLMGGGQLLAQLGTSIGTAGIMSGMGGAGGSGVVGSTAPAAGVPSGAPITNAANSVRPNSMAPYLSSGFGG